PAAGCRDAADAPGQVVRPALRRLLQLLDGRAQRLHRRLRLRGLSVAIAAPIRRPRLPRSLIALPVAAWVVAVLAELSGLAAAFHHDHLLGGGQSPWLSVPAFLVGWQLMVAAMMLPSAIPMLAAFRRVSARDERPSAARAAFLGGYLLVWTAFGVMAFAGDAVLHRLVAA